jgi:hypothetical protein
MKNQWFFEKITIDKLLSNLIKRQREVIQINKIRKEKGVIPRYTKEIQRIIRSYFKKEHTWREPWHQLHMYQMMALSGISGSRDPWSCEGSMA